jgi:hypothetical protein
VVDYRQAGTPMDLNGGFEERTRTTNQIGVNLKHSFSDTLSIDADCLVFQERAEPERWRLRWRRHRLRRHARLRNGCEGDGRQQ